MQKSMVYIFPVFDRKYLFWGKFGPKIQNCLKWNVEAKLI